jgi:siroheme synthase (precorrin-2 oxidase/ferrochelatase)
MANNILMIGCGDVGLRLAHALIDKGHQLTIIKRSPLTGIKATVIEQDISQSFSLNGLAPDYVFIILSPVLNGRSLSTGFCGGCQKCGAGFTRPYA